MSELKPNKDAQADIQQTILTGSGPLNDLIADYMRRHGLRKIQEFARVAAIGQTTIYNLVLGKTTEKGTLIKPSIETLRRLADTLRIPLHLLVYRIEPDAYGVEMVSDLLNPPRSE